MLLPVTPICISAQAKMLQVKASKWGARRPMKENSFLNALRFDGEYDMDVDSALAKPLEITYASSRHFSNVRLVNEL
jgi:hypothetical protein